MMLMRMFQHLDELRDKLSTCTILVYGARLVNISPRVTLHTVVQEDVMIRSQNQ